MDASDAASALEPLADHLASTRFTVGLLGAALLAASVVPPATAHSVSEACGHDGRLDDRFADARVLYLSYAATIALAAGLVLIPGAPLLRILYLTQALNAVLLLPALWVMRRLAADRSLMGTHALSGAGRATTGIVLIQLAAASVRSAGCRSDAVPRRGVRPTRARRDGTAGAAASAIA